MKKKGISPLIATVLLIGFTIVMAALVLNWWKAQVQHGIESSEEKMSGMNCVYTNIELGNVENTTSHNILFSVESTKGDIEGVLVRVKGNAGTQNFENITKIAEGGKKMVGIHYNNTVIGVLENAEVIPIISSNNKLKYCTNFIQKLNF